MARTAPVARSVPSDPYAFRKAVENAHVEALLLDEAMREYRQVLELSPSKLLREFGKASRVRS